MATSKSMTIVREIVGPRAIIYNDRTKTGRSIKIWGGADYDRVMTALQAAGIPSELIRTPSKKNGPYKVGNQLRIRTVEATGKTVTHTQ